jgi:hypothetical protein
MTDLLWRNITAVASLAGSSSNSTAHVRESLFAAKGRRLRATKLSYLPLLRLQRGCYH